MVNAVSFTHFLLIFGIRFSKPTYVSTFSLPSSLPCLYIFVYLVRVSHPCYHSFDCIQSTVFMHVPPCKVMTLCFKNSLARKLLLNTSCFTKNLDPITKCIFPQI